MKNYSIISDIAEARTEVVVNAANATGWMGGLLSKWFNLKGISQRLNYVTRGQLQKLALAEANKTKVKPGDVFTTPSVSPLNSQIVFHAVTMKRPGDKSSCSLDVVESCVKKLITYCHERQLSTITLPLLGCGVGGLKETDVIALYEKHFSNTGLEVTIAHPTLRL